MNNTYNYEDVLEASKEYFNNDDLAAKVFADKYALRDKDDNYYDLTPADLHRRLAKEFARIEAKYPNSMSEDEIFGLFDRFRYVVAQGSPMSAIGNPFKLQSAGNCFVVESPYDSYGGICKADQELAQLMKRRAGVGLNISNIRPKGLPTNNAAHTTDGIGVFMERFSNTCREVAQGGRRGALLLAINVHHPEIRTFINIKKNKKKVTGANISILLTDEFMKAIETGDQVELRWPVDSSNPEIIENVDAKTLWDEIIESAWESAEPGLLFQDNIKNNSIPHLYRHKDAAFAERATNPCQPGWATVLTPNGIKCINDVSIGDAIWTGAEWSTIVNKMSSGVKEVFEYKTAAGSFFGTKEHKILSNQKKIKVDSAKSIDIARGPLPAKDEFDLQSVVDGLVLGDGVMHKASNNLVLLLIGNNDKDYFDSEIKRFILEPRFGVMPKAWRVKTSFSHLPHTYEREVPEHILKASPNVVKSFLRGLYSANGSVVRNRITLKASSFKVISAVQQMLSSLGIPSYYTTNKSKKTEFYNGQYICRQSYDLNIGTLEGRVAFDTHVGFIQGYKSDKLKNIVKIGSGRSKKTFEIKSKRYVSTEPVYDLTVDSPRHTYWSGGLLVSNCGEIPMGTDSCRLLVLNTFSFVNNPFTKKATFDYKSFYEKAIKAQRLMDDLVDLEIELIDKIIKKIKSDPEPHNVKKIELDLWKEFKRVCQLGRRTGLGVTGVGDAVAALGIRYGSKKSIQTIEKIYKTLALGAHKSSAILAKERGAFPLFDFELESSSECEYLHRIWKNDEEIYKLTKKHGRRNIALTTTAPCGSISILTQTTSGIEPAYLLKYKRRKKINPDDQSSRTDFIDELGDHWQEFTVYHHHFKTWMDITGKSEIEESPYFNATSNDIDWVDKVKAQGAAQKWISHAISNTTNLPKEATKEIVSKVYKTGYKSGCKGVTIYRDGCRSGVLVSDTPADIDQSGRPMSIVPSQSPKRPKELIAEIHHATVDKTKWTVIMGLLNNEPYELFMGKTNKFAIPPRFTEGKIVRVKNGLYNLLSNSNELLVEDIIATADTDEGAWITRLMSMSLRHGIPIEYIADQLSKDGTVVDLNKVLARLLKKYVKKRDKQPDESCPQCGGHDLLYEEGCKRCADLNCGWAGCG